ncbi:snRNA-activating protein of 50kDa MW C terminal-domain-containing protein [Chytriomyces sp. MP71]|nr:snRNA-activating protein of 50kDa MW C terminal-domain-containing protein [Chytriomyces sp. MP71]
MTRSGRTSSSRRRGRAAVWRHSFVAGVESGPVGVAAFADAVRESALAGAGGGAPQQNTPAEQQDCGGGRSGGERTIAWPDEDQNSQGDEDDDDDDEEEEEDRFYPQQPTTGLLTSLKFENRPAPPYYYKAGFPNAQPIPPPPPQHVTIPQRNGTSTPASSSRSSNVGTPRPSSLDLLADAAQFAQQSILIAPTEIILSVAIFAAESSLRTGKVHFSHGLLKPYHMLSEFLVLGSQTLAQLRDAIQCISDRVTAVSEGGDFGVPGATGPMGPTPLAPNGSGYFLIEGTFYNDLRETNAKDYSKVIVDWVNEHQSRRAHFKGGFQQKSMDDTKLLDLSLKLNKRYLYVHQACCEHVIRFHDIRVAGPFDDPNMSSYPKIVYQSEVRNIRTCQICERLTASRMVMDDIRVPTNPHFMCIGCFEGFFPIPPMPKYVTLA